MKLTAEIIEGFVGSLLIKRFDQAVKTPDIHKEWWDLCTSNNKYIAIAAPRGHAKSTAITLAYALAEVIFRQSEYVIIISDTESQACQFLGAIKQELQENLDLIELFGLKKNDKNQVEFIKDTESDIIVEFQDGHKFRIQAKGSEQKLRGMIWNGKRPDLIIGDDLENDEIVLNKDRREKFRRWFYGALMPSLSVKGKIRIVGTILHMDSMLERLMPLFSDKFTVEEDLKIYSKRRLFWHSVKYKAHNRDYSKILWKDRFSEERLREIRADYIQQGLGDVYSQEYLNIPLDESVAYFKKSDFLPLTPEDKEKMEKGTKKLNYYISADLAISEKERADYSVFVVGAVDEDRRLHIVNVIRDRMDGREIVDTILALHKAYQPDAFGIEEGQISKAIGPFLREEMVVKNVFPNVYPLKHMSQDKPMRARSIQGRMRAKTVKFDKSMDWYLTLEEEMTRFPRDKHDDQVDAMAWMGQMLDKLVEAPTEKEVEDEEYDFKFRKSGLSDYGRNRTTGY